MRKLPVGIHTFSTIREDNYLYVDKTDMALDLVEKGAYYFLARPRRFGKSLFVSTLQALFEGRKKFFRGLAVYDRWDWQTTYPVITLNFAGVPKTVPGMEQAFLEILHANQKRLRVVCEETTEIGKYLRELIEKCHAKYSQRVVILVDEYDKIILDNLDQIERVQEARERLDEIYTVINDSDEHLKFVFITGVTKLTELSLFSGLNNLEDITFSEKYSSICGYTQYDLDTIFFSLLQNVDKEKLRDWYGGYNFLGDHVYNPFDLLSFLKNNNTFDNYWSMSTPPIVLKKLALRQGHYLNRLETVTISSSALGSFDVARPTVESALYLAGYLTIQHIEKIGVVTLYTLAYPNLETKYSLNDYFLDSLVTVTHDKTALQANIFSAFENGDMADMKTTLNLLFASVSTPDQNDGSVSSSEHAYFIAVLYAYLASLGLEMSVDLDKENRKSCLAVQLNNTVFFLDFSIDATGSTLEEIKKNETLQKAITEKKSIYLLRIVLSSKEKSLTQFEYKQIS